MYLVIWSHETAIVSKLWSASSPTCYINFFIGPWEMWLQFEMVEIKWISVIDILYIDYLWNCHPGSPFNNSGTLVQVRKDIFEQAKCSSRRSRGQENITTYFIKARMRFLGTPWGQQWNIKPGSKAIMLIKELEQDTKLPNQWWYHAKSAKGSCQFNQSEGVK